MITVKQGYPDEVNGFDVELVTQAEKLQAKGIRDDDGNIEVHIEDEPTDGAVLIKFKDESNSMYPGHLVKGVFTPGDVPEAFYEEKK